MSEKIITMLNPTNISRAWEEIVPLMEPVLAVAGTHKTEDVRKRLLTGQAQLWVQYEDGVDAFLVTEFETFPEKIILNIWLSAAKNDKQIDYDGLKKEIHRFANANGCDTIKIIGRDGWVKLFPEAKKQAVVLICPVSKEIH